MGTKHFSQEQKVSIISSAAEIGIRPAAKIAGVHYMRFMNGAVNLKNKTNKPLLDTDHLILEGALNIFPANNKRLCLPPGKTIRAMASGKSEASYGDRR